MNFIKKIITLFVVFSIASCKTDQIETYPFNLSYKGALKNIMRKGDLSAKANLQDFQQQEDWYALGAIANLKGEIQIFAGKPLNTIVLADSLVFDTTFQSKASLLVYASVQQWREVAIPEDIKTYVQLESFIAQAATDLQISIDQPFPFLLEGSPLSLDWHVINWPEGDTEHTHEKHIRSGLHGTIDKRAVSILGFYSDSHHAIFTHHTTNMHMHFKTLDEQLAGHVDDLTLGKGMRLKLPDN